MVSGGIIYSVMDACLFTAEVLVFVKEACNANSNYVGLIGLLAYCCVLCVFTMQQCSTSE